MRSMNSSRGIAQNPDSLSAGTVVLRYRVHLEQRSLAPSTINVRLAAVRRLAYEASDNLTVVGNTTIQSRSDFGCRFR